jgi:hypothetical protein
VSPDFVGLTFWASLYIAGNKSLHSRPVEVLLGQLVHLKSTWMPNCWQVVVHPHNLASKLFAMRDVEVSLEGEYTFLVVPISKTVPDHCFVGVLC